MNIKRAIIPKRFGRLGNQMFQIAAAIGYAEKHNFTIAIAKESLNPRIWPTYDIFADIPRAYIPDSDYDYYQEVDHDFKEIPEFSSYKPLIISGYFQSEKYFSHCRQKVIDTIFNKSKLMDVCPNDFVAVHVRRGDYLQFQDKHPVVSPEYLTSAIDYMIRNDGCTQFGFFSDDIKWCQSFIDQLDCVKYQDINFYIANTITSEIFDMNCMSQARHNIISNSSFSWWAAWLNQNPNKIVIAPNKWFGPGNAHLSEVDICPVSWLRM